MASHSQLTATPSPTLLHIALTVLPFMSTETPGLLAHSEKLGISLYRVSRNTLGMAERSTEPSYASV